MTTTRPASPSVAPARPLTVEPPPPPLALHGGAPVLSEPVPFMSCALSDEDIAAAVAVLRSGMLRQGPRCADLEQRMARLTGARHALACANGTCALHLAIEALVPPGHDVLVPAWTFIATASMVAARGCRPVFVDADPETYQFDPADAARKITPRTRALIATHLYGCPADIGAIQSLAQAYGLRVIYDAAQAHAARYDDRPLGQFGDAVTYSFYATKNLATGEGGMVTCNDDDLARTLALLRSHGETDKYLHERIGYNYRLNDVAAAIGCSRLGRLEAQTRRRQEIACRYDAALADIPGLFAPRITAGSGPVYHLYVVRLDLRRFTCSRDQFCAALKAEGVPTAIHYPRALTQQPAFAPFAPAPCPVAERLARELFALPIHPDLTDDQVSLIIRAVRKVAEAYAA